MSYKINTALLKKKHCPISFVEYWNALMFSEVSSFVFWTWQLFFFFFAKLVRFPQSTLTTLSQHPFTECGSTEDFLTGSASLAEYRQLTFGWTSCNILFLFVNDLRFRGGFVWQQNRRWTIMYVLIKSLVFLFHWTSLWVERTKPLFNSYWVQNCPS